jgi:hypothetical protein
MFVEAAGQAARAYRWCNPPTCEMEMTSPRDGGSTLRGTGELRASDKCVRQLW